MKRFGIGALAIAPWLLIATSAAHSSGHDEAELQVSLTVVASCRIDTGGRALDFGNVRTGAVEPRQTRAGIDVACTRGQPYSIGFGSGLHGDGTTRRMAAGDATVDYQLYARGDSSRPLGAVGSGSELRGVGDGAAHNVPVTGRIPAQAIDTPGRYTDTVRVTVLW